MGHFWDVIQEYLDRQDFPVSDRRLAEKLELGSSSTIANWRDGLTQVPRPKNIRAVSDLVGRSYQAVFDAAADEVRERGERETRRGTPGA